MRSLWLIADDYALSPGVDDAILDLLKRERISGTGCMTLMPEWKEEAARLRDVPGSRAIGLHLTLTDQAAARGPSPLAPRGRLPSLGRLLAGTATRRIADAAIHEELDRQLDLFTAALGRAPDFIDGHQHVHFLGPVRRWLRGRASGWTGRMPLLRGAPSLALAPAGGRGKVATVAALAAGFDASMRRAGYRLMTPLAGFYDWKGGSPFEPALAAALQQLPDGGVFMCHPGRVDDTLRRRDHLLAPREGEYELLGGDAFPSTLKRLGVVPASVAR